MNKGLLMIYDRLIEAGLVFLIIFTPFAHGAVQPWAVAVFEATAAMMFLLWIFKMISKNTLEVSSSPVVFLAVFFILYVSIQLAVSPITRSALPGLLPHSVYPWATKTELLRIIAYAMIFFVSLNTIKTRQQIIRIISVIIVVGSLMGVLFLMRYFGAEVPRGIINPDHYSAYLGMIVPLIFGYLLVREQTPGTQDTIYAKRLLLIFCAIIMSTALFFTMSRGGIFSFIAALLFMAVLVLTRRSIKKRGWVLSAVVVFVILSITWLGATPVIERILSIKVEIASLYFGGRLPIWQSTIDIIKDYPFLGTGFGTFNYVFPKYETEGLAYHYAHAHSDLLELLSDTGIVGFFLLGVGSLVSMVWVFRRFYRRHDPYIISLSIGFLGSLAGMFVHSLVDFNLRIPANAILVTIIMALFISALNQRSGHRSDEYRQFSISRKGKAVLYVITILLTGAFLTASVRPAIADYYYNLMDDSQLSLQDSRRLITRAVELDPANALYRYELGHLLSKDISRYDINRNSELDQSIWAALDSYKEAIRLNPTNPKYHQSLAWTYGILADLSLITYERPAAYNTKFTELAHRYFNKAVSLEPNNPYRYRTYAVWLFNHPDRENIEKGIALFKKAVELEPEVAEEAFDRYYEIARNYLSLEKITPSSPDGYLLLAGYMKKKGMEKEFRIFGQKAEALMIEDLENTGSREKEQIRMKLAGVYRFLGEYDKAIKEYRKLLDADPESFWITFRTGEVYEVQGAYKQAIGIYKKASDIEPQNSLPYFSLARLYRELGYTDKETEMWQAILDLEEPDVYAKLAAKKALDKERIRK